MSHSLLAWLGLSDEVEPCTEVAEKLSMLRVLGDRTTTLTKGGRIARIIEMRGKDYSGMDSETVHALYTGRKMVFDSQPTNIVMFAQTHRIKVSLDISGEEYAIPLAGDIAKKWAENFSISHRTRHFIVLCTAVDNFVDRVGLMAEGGGNDELYRLLDDYTKKALISYKDYNPHLLHGDEVSTYWAWLISGRHRPRRLPASGYLDEILATADLDFPAGQRHGIYKGEKPRYSTMLHVAKVTASGTSKNLLEGLFRLHQELSVWQIFRSMEKSAILAEIDDRIRNTTSFTAAGDILLLELDEMKTRVQADEITGLQHKFVIEVYGDTQADMELAAREVVNVLENQGFGLKREGRNHEAHFWSRFPEFDSRVPKGPPNPRSATITSENASHFVTFATAGQGLDSCSWGDMPVTHFKTPQGSEYAFTFQASPADKASGHTLAIGGTGLGKTVLISLLFAMSTKYPNWRGIMLDRLHGMEVFTRMMGGDYLDILDGLDMNPLALPDNPETTAHLANWFQILTGKTGEEDVKQIDNAIRQWQILDASERTLGNLQEAFGLAQPGSIRSALDRWISGPFSHFFTAKRDALDFSSQLVGIDMTTLLDMPDVLAPLSYHMFYKLMLQGKEKGGYGVFVDEIDRYLKNAIFAPRIDFLLQEIRKQDGVFVGACQSAETILKSPSADKFLSNIETYLIFPNPGARREHFGEDGIRLNDQEFTWMTATAKPREVLCKRKGGESIVLNINLEPLGRYLNTFNSSVDAVARLNELRRSRHDWQEAYLSAA